MNNIQKLIVENLTGIAYSISDDDMQKYGKDWTFFYKPDPEIILFPKTTEEVQTIVKFANKNQIGIVPSGGRTGLSGGALAKNKEMLVSLELMDNILEFNSINQTVKVQAGVITENLQDFAWNKGLYYPVDFASKGSSQIGGNIATNAGGVRVLRYGLTRNWVTGIKMVTGSGDIVETNNGLIKNATGYDLRHLIIGSEGSLGIVTEAIIKLTKQPKNVNVLFLAIADLKHAISVLEIFQKDIELSAFEFISHKTLEYCLAQSNMPRPFKQDAPFYLLVEFENTHEGILKTIENIVLNLYNKALISDDILGVTDKEIKTIWYYREMITEAIAKYTPYKNDISVLTSYIPQFVEQASKLLISHYPDFEVLWFGHIADGNLHICILKPEKLDILKFKLECDTVSQLLFALIKEYKGSISAEHGLGLMKKDYAHFSRTETELALMKSIKQIFDPNGIMNPGKTI